MWAVPRTLHHTQRVRDGAINHGLRGCARSRMRPWAAQGTVSSLLGDAAWELVLWRMLDAARGFRGAGLSCQQDSIAPDAASSPGRARGAGKAIEGEGKAIEEVALLQQRAGDGHSWGWSRLGPEGSRGVGWRCEGRQAASEQKLH